MQTRMGWSKKVKNDGEGKTASEKQTEHIWTYYTLLSTLRMVGISLKRQGLISCADLQWILSACEWHWEWRFSVAPPDLTPISDTQIFPDLSGSDIPIDSDFDLFFFFFAERFPDFISPIFSPNLFFEHCRVGGGDRVQSKVQTMWQSLGWDGMSPWGIRQWLFYREKMMIQWSWATRLSDKPTNTTIYAGYFDAETENRYQCDINRYV